MHFRSTRQIHAVWKKLAFVHFNAAFSIECLLTFFATPTSAQLRPGTYIEKAFGSVVTDPVQIERNSRKYTILLSLSVVVSNFTNNRKLALLNQLKRLCMRLWDQVIEKTHAFGLESCLMSQIPWQIGLKSSLLRKFCQEISPNRTPATLEVVNSIRVLIPRGYKAVAFPRTGPHLWLVTAA